MSIILKLSQKFCMSFSQLFFSFSNNAHFSSQISAASNYVCNVEEVLKTVYIVYLYFLNTVHYHELGHKIDNSGFVTYEITHHAQVCFPGATRLHLCSQQVMIQAFSMKTYLYESLNQTVHYTVYTKDRQRSKVSSLIPLLPCKQDQSLYMRIQLGCPGNVPKGCPTPRWIFFNQAKLRQN